MSQLHLPNWTTLTDLGDSAVLFPTAVVVSGWLFLAGIRDAARIPLISALIGALGIGLLKVANLGCNGGLAGIGVHSPSGHAALSAAVYLPIAAIAASQFNSPWQYLSLGGAVLLVALIAFSRIHLGLHSNIEVLVGLLWGMLVGCISTWCALRVHPKPAGTLGVLIPVVIVTVALVGTRLPLESLVRYFSHHIFPSCS